MSSCVGQSWTGSPMANRRMFARAITESDAFLDLPQGAQLLWFHVGLIADDDGFANGVKRTMLLCGATEDDLAVLVETGFLLRFDSGVYLIRDWHLNNQIRHDRYHETDFKAEKSMVTLTEDKRYEWRLPDGCHAVAADKESLEETREEKPRQDEKSPDEMRGGAEGGTSSLAPCPTCGQICTTCNEGGFPHLWCPDCGDFIDFGEGFRPA